VRADRDGVAFVLGGGGHLGAHEVGMPQALLDPDIAPSLIVGTSVGAINGAVVATDPTTATAARLEAVWSEIDQNGVFDGSSAQVETAAPRRMERSVATPPTAAALSSWTTTSSRGAGPPPSRRAIALAGAG
jgi:predicted acylesterase/phospholipase RssA